MIGKLTYQELEQKVRELEKEAEQRHSEKALHESDEIYRMLFEHSGFAIVLIDAETGERIAFNKEAYERLGYTRDEFKDMSLSKADVDKSVREVSDHRKRTIEQGSDFFEVRQKTKSGENRDVLISAVALKINGRHYINNISTDITERKKAEAALRESETFSTSLLEHSPDPIIVVNADTSIKYVNPTFELFTGYTLAELENALAPHPWWVEDSQSGDVDERKEAILKGTPKREKIFKKSSGEFFWVESVTTPIKQNGRLQYALSTWVDITDRKKAEEALRKSEKFNSSLLENSPTPLLVVNTDTSIRYVNPKLEELTGYSLAELKGAKAPYPWWTVNPKSGTVTEREKSINKGVKGLEKLFKKKSGEDFWVEINTVTNIPDEERSYALTTWVDISDRKRVEAALQENEKRYRDLFNDAPVGYIEYDRDGIITKVNQRELDMLGYTHDEMLGQPAWSFVVEAKEGQEIIKLKLTGDKPPSKNLVRNYIRKDKTTFPGLLEDVILKDDADRIIGIRTTIQDITERTRIEETRAILEIQLQQAQKMESIGTLAGGIAHDFNNILSPIMAYSELAMMDLPADSPVQHNLKGIYRAGERARDLVMQILTFSRKGEGKRIAIKVTPILKDALKMLRASIPTTIDIQQTLAAKYDTVLTDPTQVQQIILNLCTNASHAMKEKGGILEVSLVQEDLDLESAAQYSGLAPGSYLKLTVRDTGSGIDDKTIKKIFEPYFTTKGVGEGTGMGLALVHGVVKSCGGDITVESELGKGTTFNVYLPRVEEEVASVSEPAAQLPKGSERVLFVDDEKISVDAMTAIIENLGYEVTSRTSSIEALEAFKNDPDSFDLVITDMTMPNMTGRELAKEIMSIRSDMPIILCTGFSEQIDESSAKEMGISAYLMKPIAMGDMSRAIREVLDKK